MKQLDIKKIDSLYYYDESDLGCTLEKNKTIFKFWSPLADSVELCIYNDFNVDEKKVFTMEKSNNGVWTKVFEENLE